MISPFSVKPKPQNNYSKGFVIGLLACAAGLCILYLSIEKYKGIVGMLVIGFITAAVLIYTKYVAPIYFYDLTFDSENKPVFVVRQRTGRRESTLCRVDLCNIKRVEKETAEQRRSHKTERGYLKYIYTPTMFPEVTYRLTVSSRYEKAEIVIEITNELAEALAAFAKEAQELYIDDEE